MWEKVIRKRLVAHMLLEENLPHIILAQTPARMQHRRARIVELNRHLCGGKIKTLE
jgi:hypothetical protein